MTDKQNTASTVSTLTGEELEKINALSYEQARDALARIVEQLETS